MLCVCGIEIEKEITVADRLQLFENLSYLIARTHPKRGSSNGGGLFIPQRKV